MKRARQLVITAVLLALAVTLSAPRARAATAPPESLFVDANAAYEAGDYMGAIDRYGEVVAAGVVHPDLYFNLGSAWFKTGDLGRAVLWYERARRLAPRDEDVRENLVVVRSLLRDKDLLPRHGGVRGALTAWHTSLSVAESVAVASSLYGVLCLVAIAAVFRRSAVVRAIYGRLSWISPARLFGLDMTQDFFLALGIVFVAAALFAGSSYSKVRDDGARRSGVVVTEEAPVYSGPSRDATLQFKVHEGTIMTVRDERTGWVRVDLPGDLSGWVDARSLERI